MGPKQGTSKKGLPMHYSVGALIKKDNKYLLIDRKISPYGFAGPAGHIDEGEFPEESIIREVKEETGLKVVKHSLIFEEEINWNWCSKGVKIHYWYLFKCETSGEIKRNMRETKLIGLFSESEIKNLKLEPVWKYWFEKLKVI